MPFLCQHLAETRVQSSVIYRLFTVGGNCRQFATQQAYSVVMAAVTVARRRHRNARPVPEYFEYRCVTDHKTYYYYGY